MIKTIEIDTSKEKASCIIKWLKDEIEKDKRLASNTLYPSQRMFYKLNWRTRMKKGNEDEETSIAEDMAAIKKLITPETNNMGRVKEELVSEVPCVYCDNLFDKRLEDAGYTACPTCQRAVSKSVSKLLELIPASTYLATKFTGANNEDK